MRFSADEYNINWYPTLRAMWSPIGQQVMIRTPGRPIRYSIGHHAGETVVGAISDERLLIGELFESVQHCSQFRLLY